MLFVALSPLATACQNPDLPAPLPVQAIASPTPDPKGPINIGVLHATTGGYAPQGVAANEGILFALGIEQPVEVAGRKVVPLFGDTEGKPGIALALTRKLVEQDKVALLIGPASELELSATAGYLQTQTVPLLVTFPWASAVAPGHPRLYQVTGAPLTHAVAGWYAAQRAGYRQVALAVSDYPGGWSARDAFQRAFQLAGGSVAGEVAFPLGAPNAAPYLADARRLGAAAGLLAMPNLLGAAAADAVTAVGQTPVMVSAAGAVPSAVPPSPSLAEGTLNYGEWRVAIDTAENRLFTEGIRKAFKKEPTLHHYYGYLAGKVALQALTAVAGRTEDPSALQGALAAVDFLGPAGRFRFDRGRGPLIPVHVWPGERAARGGPAALIIEDVGMDWRVPN